MGNDVSRGCSGMVQPEAQPTLNVSKLSALEKAVADRDVRISFLLQTIEKGTHKIEDLNSQLKNKDSEINQLKQLLQQQQLLVDQLQQKDKSAQEQLNAMKQLEEKLSEKDGKMKELEEASKALPELQEQVQKLETELKAASESASNSKETSAHNRSLTINEYLFNSSSSSTNGHREKRQMELEEKERARSTNFLRSDSQSDIDLSTMTDDSKRLVALHRQLKEPQDDMPALLLKEVYSVRVWVERASGLSGSGSGAKTPRKYNPFFVMQLGDKNFKSAVKHTNNPVFNQYFSVITEKNPRTMTINLFDYDSSKKSHSPLGDVVIELSHMFSDPSKAIYDNTVNLRNSSATLEVRICAKIVPLLSLRWPSSFDYKEVGDVIRFANGALNTTDSSGQTPLIKAVAQKELNVIKALIHAKADTTMKDSHRDGVTAVHQAAVSNQIEVLDMLLESEAPIDVCDNQYRTPLSVAAQTGHIQFVQKLLDGKANPNLADVEGHTPLMVAISEGHTEITRALLNAEASVDAVNNKGMSPLMIAALANAIEEGTALLEHKADTSARDMAGKTALLMAASRGHIGFVKTLIQHGADVNLADTKSNTPVMLAAEQGFSETALLIARCKECNMQQHNDNGKTAINLAAENGHKSLAADLTALL